MEPNLFNYYFIVTILICITRFTGLVNGLYCYQCNSTGNPDCLEQFDYSTAKIKPTYCKVAEAAFCIKTTGIWAAMVGITRWCSSMDMGNQCQITDFPDHPRLYRSCLFTCRGDGCNTAVTARHLVPAKLSVLLMAAVSAAVGLRN